MTEFVKTVDSKLVKNTTDNTLQRNLDARSLNHYCSGKAEVLHNLSVYCSLRYPAWNAHAPYCHLWTVRFYNMFQNYLINGTIKKKRQS
jgi:hypothetical protein